MKILRNAFVENVACKHCTSLIEISRDDVIMAGGKDKLICPVCKHLLCAEEDTIPKQNKNETVNDGVVYFDIPQGFYISNKELYTEMIVELQSACVDLVTKKPGCKYMLDVGEFYEQYIKLLKVRGVKTLPTIMSVRYMFERLGYDHDGYFDAILGLKLRNNVINPDGTVTHPHKVHSDHAPHTVNDYYRKDGTLVRGYRTGVVQ